VRPSLELLEDRLAPATITVNTMSDDNVPNDGSVSLREAIQAINNGSAGLDQDIINQFPQLPGPFGVNDTINFNIPTAGTVQTINVGGTGNGALPALLRPVTINGYSEKGASQNTLANGDNAKILIELNGANAGPNADGILVGTGAGGSTIRGLAINRFSLNGIELQSGGNTVAGNFVGTNPSGAADEANQNDGIHVSNANSNTIGGTTPADRNVVSGNRIDGIHIVGTTALPATGNLVEGNFVGVNAAGTGPVGLRAGNPAPGSPEGNGFFGIEVSGGNANTVGGKTAGARNVVGFNADGIAIDNGGQNNLVEGNFVGVGADGVTAAGNVRHGVVLFSSGNPLPPLGPGQANEPPVSGNTVGGTAPGAGNVIAFNGSAGVAIFGNPPPNNATPKQNAGNAIEGNSIFQNARGNPASGAGIDLSNAFAFPKDDGVTADDSQGHGAVKDPNNFQNAPVLTSVSVNGGSTTITGTLTQSVSPKTTYRVEFFVSNPDPLNGVPEGQAFLGSQDVNTDGTGTAAFTFTVGVALAPGQVVTATATNTTPDPSSPAGAVNVRNTSEFSDGLTVPAPPSSSPPPSSPPGETTPESSSPPSSPTSSAGAAPAGPTMLDIDRVLFDELVLAGASMGNAVALFLAASAARDLQTELMAFPQLQPLDSLVFLFDLADSALGSG
jgi:CSLREA domain-containing protein